MIIKARNERADIQLFELNMYIFMYYTLYILRHTRAVNSSNIIYIFFLYKFKRDRINSALERVGTVFLDDLG